MLLESAVVVGGIAVFVFGTTATILPQTSQKCFELDEFLYGTTPASEISHEISHTDRSM